MVPNYVGFPVLMNIEFKWKILQITNYYQVSFIHSNLLFIPNLAIFCQVPQNLKFGMHMQEEIALGILHKLNWKIIQI